VSSLRQHGTLTGYIRCDFLITYMRKDIGRLIHHFTDPDDVALIDGTLRAALGL